MSLRHLLLMPWLLAGSEQRSARRIARPVLRRRR